MRTSLGMVSLIVRRPRLLRLLDFGELRLLLAVPRFALLFLDRVLALRLLLRFDRALLLRFGLLLRLELFRLRLLLLLLLRARLRLRDVARCPRAPRCCRSALAVDRNTSLLKLLLSPPAVVSCTSNASFRSSNFWNQSSQPMCSSDCSPV